MLRQLEYKIPLVLIDNTRQNQQGDTHNGDKQPLHSAATEKPHQNLTQKQQHIVNYRE